jgi:hypothetical protein
LFIFKVFATLAEGVERDIDRQNQMWNVSLREDVFARGYNKIIRQDE